MDERFNTQHTDKIQIEVLGHRLQLAQDPNSGHVGTTIWDASMVLVKYLERNCRKGEFSSLKLRGKRVIELGSGCGLGGLGMALLGCNVVSTDQVEVLPLLLRNVERNMARAKHSFSDSPYVGSLGSIEVAELDWGNEQHIKAVEPPFDYIIGTDIVYKEDLLEPLVGTMLALAGPKTTILLGYEFRSSAVHETMLELWKQHFNVKVVPKGKMDLKYQHESIQLFILRQKGQLANITIASAIGEKCFEEELDVAHQNREVTHSETFPHGDVAQPKENASASASSQLVRNARESKDTEQYQHFEEGFTITELDPAKDLSYNASNCSTGLDEWEARRLGSMAARLLQNAP